MKYIYLITAIWCGATLTSHAQQAAQTDSIYRFTLQDCINYAYQHQDTVINAALDVKSADYKVKEITGQGLPQVSGSANFQDYVKIPVTLIPAQFFGGTAGSFVPIQFGVKYQSNMGLNVSQILFDGSYLIGLKASKTYKQLSQRSYTRSKIQANANVTKAYYQVLVSNEQIDLIDADLKQLKEQFDQTVAQNKQGFVEKIDVQRIEVQYNNLLTTRENTVRLLALGYQMLKFQMGMPVNASLILSDKLEDISLSDGSAATTTDTNFYHNRIEYQLLETQEKLNELDVDNKKAKFYPTLSFNGNYNLSYQNNDFGNLYSRNFPSGYIGLTLNVPIFTGFQHSYQLKESKISVMQAKNNLENAKNGFLLQANSAYITYVNSLKSLDNQRQNQALAREVLRVSRIKYQQGVGSSIEVTQAQTSLEDADNQYVRSLYDALISKVDLDQAYGRIK